MQNFYNLSGCIRRLQCNVDFGCQLSICEGTGKPQKTIELAVKAKIKTKLYLKDLLVLRGKHTPSRFFGPCKLMLCVPK
jgi:hypothetical protein